MINILPFYVPVSVFKVKNWEEKRKILEESLSDIRKIDDKDEFILTDYHDYDGDKINATENPEGYINKRLEEYPHWQECIHALLDGGEHLEDLQSKRQSIKTKYPKE